MTLRRLGPAIHVIAYENKGGFQSRARTASTQGLKRPKHAVNVPMIHSHDRTFERAPAVIRAINVPKVHPHGIDCGLGPALTRRLPVSLQLLRCLIYPVQLPGLKLAKSDTDCSGTCGMGLSTPISWICRNSAHS